MLGTESTLGHSHNKRIGADCGVSTFVARLVLLTTLLPSVDSSSAHQWSEP